MPRAGTIEILNTSEPPQPRRRGSGNFSFGCAASVIELDNADLERRHHGVIVPVHIRGQGVVRMPFTGALSEEKTGVLTRTEAKAGVDEKQLGIEAGNNALDGLQRRVDILVVSSSHSVEGLGKSIANGMKIEPRIILEVQAACSGAALGWLTLFRMRIVHGDDRVMFLTPERYRGTLDPNAPTFDTGIFGDDARAMLFRGDAIEPVGKPKAYKFPKTDDHLITMRTKPTKPGRYTKVIPVPYSPEFHQEGPAVYRRVRSRVRELILSSFEDTGIDPAAVTSHPHQGSERMVMGVAEMIPEFAVVGDWRRGNISSGSIIRAFEATYEAGYVGQDSVVNWTGFGAGLFAAAVNFRIR